MNEIASTDSEMRPRRFIVLVPLILFIGLTALFLVRLNGATQMATQTTALQTMIW